MTNNEKLRDIAYTLDCLSLEDVNDLSRFEKSNGYWQGLEHCRDNAEANADYVKCFLDNCTDHLASDDFATFVLDQLARIVEFYRIADEERR